MKTSEFEILVVDDTLENLQLLSDVLKKENYKVREVDNGEMALKSVKLKKPDLILLDIVMPDMNGFEVCSKLKKDKETESIPVIFLSALESYKDIVHAFNIGGVDYIIKPFQEEVVLVKVRTHLENYRMKNHLEDEVKKRTEYLDNAYSMLQRKETQYRNLVEALHDNYFFYSTDINGLINYVSPSIKSVTGFTQKEFKGFSQHVSSNHYENILNQSIKKLNSEKKQISYKLEIIHKNGKTCFLEITEYPVFSGNTIISIEGIAKDVTKQKELEQRLQINEDLLTSQSKHASIGELIGMIAHQWKQPISVISLEASTMLLNIEFDKVSNYKLTLSMNNIMEMTKHVSNTIDDFRNFLKPKKTKEHIKIDSVIEKVKIIIAKTLDNENISLQIINKSTSNILIYKNDLIHVLINIINNAKDAILEKKMQDGKIKLNITENERYLIIEICDNAGGIPENIKEKIGTRYFTTKNNKGTGLGLYMSKIIIENKLDGELDWYNQNGACFKITISKTI